MSSNLQKKLFDFEASPPANAWERIAFALAKEEADLGERLYDFEAHPPAGAWAAIENALNQDGPQAKSVPLFVRYRTPLRYIAAASFIAVVLVSATLWLRRSETAPQTLAGNPPAASQPARADAQARADDTDAGTEPDAALAGTKAKDLRTAAIIKRSFVAIRPQNIFSSLSFSRRFIPRQASPKATLNLSAPDNFMVYSDNEGHAMKLPKKLFSLVSCEDGDETCKQRIHQLQQKMAANLSAADFVGMLDLVR